MPVTGPRSARQALRWHWPEYAMEAAELGLFMMSACVFAVLLWHPASPVQQAVAEPFLRRVLMGLAMGATAIAIIYSPIGKRSGAHFNPAVTLTFLRLGKIAPWDAAFYIGAQFLGGVAGVALAALALGALLADPAVRYVATRPGGYGAWVAFAGEFAIAFVLMTVILTVSSRPKWNHLTGLFAGMLVALYITFEDPLSGMSMNPARTFGSAMVGQIWDSIWIYFTAPPLAMLLAAEVYLRVAGARSVLCAKLHHHNRMRCIFRCSYPG
jgi:aquaporin Z